jgi:hypothetical protein
MNLTPPNTLLYGMPVTAGDLPVYAGDRKLRAIRCHGALSSTRTPTIALMPHWYTEHDMNINTWVCEEAHDGTTVMSPHQPDVSRMSPLSK